MKFSGDLLMGNAEVLAALTSLEFQAEMRLQEIREAWETQDYLELGLIVSRVLDDYQDTLPNADAEIAEASDVAHDRKIDDSLEAA